MIQPGDKCTVIFSHCGDEGKIVVVERDFDPANEQWDDKIWTERCRLLVTSLGSPLHSVQDGDKTIYTHMTRPYPPEWLRKLPDVEDEDEKEVQKLELIGKTEKTAASCRNSYAKADEKRRKK